MFGIVILCCVRVCVCVCVCAYVSLMCDPMPSKTEPVLARGTEAKYSYSVRTCRHTSYTGALLLDSFSIQQHLIVKEGLPDLPVCRDHHSA